LTGEEGELRGEDEEGRTRLVVIVVDGDPRGGGNKDQLGSG